MPKGQKVRVITAQQDEVIRKCWAHNAYGHHAAKRAAQLTGLTSSVVQRRATELGLVFSRERCRWTEPELTVVEKNAHLALETIQRKLRLVSPQGVLAEHRHWFYHNDEIVKLLFAARGEFDLRKVNQTWLMGLLEPYITLFQITPKQAVAEERERTKMAQRRRKRQIAKPKRRFTGSGPSKAGILGESLMLIPERPTITKCVRERQMRARYVLAARPVNLNHPG
jgi:hypothetical protein